MQRGNASSNSWYGGAYIAKDGSLVVLVVEPDEEKINIIREYTQNDDICVEPCLYSYSDLIMVIDTLNANLNRLDAAGVCIQEMYEDIMRSRVIIRIDELTEEKESLVRSIIDKPCMLIENAIKVEMSEKETADVEEISNTLCGIGNFQKYCCFKRRGHNKQQFYRKV